MNKKANGRYGQGGFTLAETLIAILLMSFVGLIVTGGISMGARVYGEITERSNAELLLSTTLMRMRDELDRVEETWTQGNTTYFRTSTSNWRSLVTAKGNEKGVFIKEYKGYNLQIPANPFAADGEIRELVTNAMGGKDGLYATFTNLAYVESDDTDSNGYFEVTGLRVEKEKGGNKEVLAWIGSGDKKMDAGTYSYKIRCLQQVVSHTS